MTLSLCSLDNLWNNKILNFSELNSYLVSWGYVSGLWFTVMAGLKLLAKGFAHRTHLNKMPQSISYQPSIGLNTYQILHKSLIMKWINELQCLLLKLSILLYFLICKKKNREFVTKNVNLFAINKSTEAFQNQLGSSVIGDLGEFSPEGSSLEEQGNAKICKEYHPAEPSLLVISLTLPGGPPATAWAGSPQGPRWSLMHSNSQCTEWTRSYPGNVPCSTSLAWFVL